MKKLLTVVLLALVGCNENPLRPYVNPCHVHEPYLPTTPQKDTTAEQAKNWAKCDSLWYARPQ